VAADQQNLCFRAAVDLKKSQVILLDIDIHHILDYNGLQSLTLWIVESNLMSCTQMVCGSRTSEENLQGCIVLGPWPGIRDTDNATQCTHLIQFLLFSSNFRAHFLQVAWNIFVPVHCPGKFSNGSSGWQLGLKTVMKITLLFLVLAKETWQIKIQ